jgi:hypothetical protein
LTTQCNLGSYEKSAVAAMNCEIAGNIKNRLLRVPRTVAARLVGLVAPVAAEKLVEREITFALEELSRLGEPGAG